MEEIIVTVSVRGNTVVKEPNDGNIVAGRGRSIRIIWTAEDDQKIQQIDHVLIGEDAGGNEWPFKQPSRVTGKVFEVLDPNTKRATYPYVLTLTTNSGKTLADPEIENQGPNGDDRPDQDKGGQGGKGKK